MGGPDSAQTVLDEARQALYGDRDCDLPLCIKPADAGGPLGVARIDTALDLLTYCRVSNTL